MAGLNVSSVVVAFRAPNNRIPWDRSIPAPIELTATSPSSSNGALIGVGDVLKCGEERIQVTDRSFSASGQTLVTGVGAKNNENILLVSDGSQFHRGETLMGGSERMAVTESDRECADEGLKRLEKRWERSHGPLDAARVEECTEAARKRGERQTARRRASDDRARGKEAA